ncbi:hypothetical protein FOL47_003159, partial [Perkinsus chesapeaki]
LAYLSKVLTSGEAASLAVDKSFIERPSTLSHRIRQIESKSYTERAGMVLSRVEDFEVTELICLSALKPPPARSGPVQAPESRAGSTPTGERARSGKWKFFKEESPYLPKNKCILFPSQHDFKPQARNPEGPGKRKQVANREHPLAAVLDFISVMVEGRSVSPATLKGYVSALKTSYLSAQCSSKLGQRRYPR